jgi:hypothetical protein
VVALMSDQVNHPAHYGGDTPFEVIKVLEAWGLTNNAYRFNAIKYLARAGKKGANGRIATLTAEDLRKAIWYIEREIQVLEAQP